MPMFGRIGTSFSPWQSQFGETSTIREIWKFGLPSTTALVYSAMRQFNSSFALLLSKWMASKLQAPRQRPQPTQFSWFTCIFLAASSKTRPPLAHSFWQRLQPRHLRSLIYGFPLQCCSVFPAREPQPMPMFLMVPPKPVISCPLKWVRLIKISASITARPILAAFTYSPPFTGTSISSVPFNPSPMMIGQPTESGVNPFSQAHSRCSRAFFRLPGYMVLQSVRNGLPPNSFTTSATALA